MSRIMRVCVVVASLMSLFGVMSSSAGAVTWVNDGGTSFTATGGPWTLTAPTVPMFCTGIHVTGTMAASGFVGLIWPAASGTTRSTGCTIIGPSIAVHCAYTLTTFGQTPPVTSANVDMTCDMKQGATKICHIHGATAAHYISPPSARLILTPSTALRTTNPGPSCPLGHNVPLTLTQQTWTLTSANAPIITRLP